MLRHEEYMKQKAKEIDNMGKTVEEIKSKWDIRQENRELAWSSFSDEQKDALLSLVKAWAEIRTSYSEFCHPSYGDICSMDTAYWNVRGTLFSKNVEVEEWSH